MNKKNIRIAIIGAGKLAWSLIPSLLYSGYRISSVISKSLKDAASASEKFKIKHCSDQLTDIPEEVNLVLLTVPDDKLEEVARQLASGKKIKAEYFVHFSGVYSSHILKVLTHKKTSSASFHIMQTFPSKKRIRLEGSYAAVETSDTELKKILTKIASDLKLKPFPIDASKKTEYHLAGVFASNFLLSNLNAAAKLFISANKDVDFYNFIFPIIQRTLKNIRSSGISQSLSGPVERGDIRTVELHIEKIKENKILLMSYLIQSLGILEIKTETGNLTSDHLKIKAILLQNLEDITGKNR